MNRPIPSWLLPLWQNESVRNYLYENVCHLYVHSRENQVIFMWNVLHEHSFWKRGKRQLRSGSEVCVWANWPIRLACIPVSVAWSDWEYFYYPLDEMLVHRKVTPNIKFANTYLYTWVERGIVRVKCHAQEHNTMFPARARTQTAQNRKEIQKSNNRLFTQTAYNF